MVVDCPVVDSFVLFDEVCWSMVLQSGSGDSWRIDFILCLVSPELTLRVVSVQFVCLLCVTVDGRTSALLSRMGLFPVSLFFFKPPFTIFFVCSFAISQFLLQSLPNLDLFFQSLTNSLLFGLLLSGLDLSFFLELLHSHLLLFFCFSHPLFLSLDFKSPMVLFFMLHLKPDSLLLFFH